MNPIVEFFINNFALLCIVISLIFISVQNYLIHKNESIFIILISCCTLLLAVAMHVEKYAKVYNNVMLATIMAVICYSLRPICIYLFIRLADNEVKKVHFIFVIPLFINMLIYSCALFINVDFLHNLVFYFVPSEDGLIFTVGSILRYTSHVIGALYLGYLLYVTIKKLKGKHVSHAITIIICSLFVIGAVASETRYPNKNISILNVTIAVSTLVYYLFIYTEMTRTDPLTNTFKREMYYADIKRYSKDINAVIQLDMNGLKHINDTLGHEQGDAALKIIASIFQENIKNNMTLYRVGGDEFTILITNGKEEDILDYIANSKTKLQEKGYYFSAGYAIRDEKNQSLSEIIVLAEHNMYKDKEEFYKDAKFDRRKR